MDTRSLETFALVVRQRSFAAAAREQNVDPSSISRVIAALEEELGVRLFQRNSRRLTLTEAGHNYFQRIEPLIEELRNAKDAALEVAEQVSGTLRVTASNSFGLKVLMPRLPAFAAAYPQLTLDVLLTDAVVDLLAERVDVAVRLGPLADSGLVAQLLMRTRYCVVASPAYLEAHTALGKPTDLSKHECLLFPLPGFRSRWIFRDRRGQCEIAVRGRTLVSSGMALQYCALAGMGPALLPQWLVQDDIAAGRLVDVFPKWQVTATDFDTAAWFVYPSRTYVPLKVRLFMEHLRKELV